jgi:hypothetical protein
MPKGDAEFLQALICEVRQDRDVDVVLSKALGILGHAKPFEPVQNLLHCGALPLTCDAAGQRYTIEGLQANFG